CRADDAERAPKRMMTLNALLPHSEAPCPRPHDLADATYAATPASQEAGQASDASASSPVGASAPWANGRNRAESPAAERSRWPALPTGLEEGEHRADHDDPRRQQRDVEADADPDVVVKALAEARRQVAVEVVDPEHLVDGEAAGSEPTEQHE